MQYIPAIKFEILFARISYVSFKTWNVQRLSANNFNKNQFWENWNRTFVQLNIMAIFTTLYEILGISGGEIYLGFKAGATVIGQKKADIFSIPICFILLWLVFLCMTV